VYAHQGDTIYVNLFAAGTAQIETTDHGKLVLRQDTRYPWDGSVRITVTPEQARTFTMKVRIPGWARNEPVPSDLYRFEERLDEPVRLTVAGAPVPMSVDRGYVAITRRWSPGDVIDLVLPMPVRRIVANEQVAADRGRVALQRGPIVYAAEWPDNPGGRVRNLVVPAGTKLSSEFRPDLLKGVQVITGRALAVTDDGKGGRTTKEQDFTAIPYATWANRGKGQMIVWLAAVPEAVTDVPAAGAPGSAKAPDTGPQQR
jgi:DUF1680 family protein